MQTKVSVRETISLTIRGYKIWWKIAPRMLTAATVNAVVGALTPFVGIYIGALLVNEIAGNRDRERLIFLAVAALVGAGVMAMLNAIASRWNNYEDENRWYTRNEIYFNKLLEMDFVKVDSYHIRDLISTINQNDKWIGWGIERLLGRPWGGGYDGMVKAIFSIMGAVALSASLFIIPIPGTDGITILNHPLIGVAVVVLMMVLIFVSATCSAKADAYWAIFSEDEEIRMGRRRFNFFHGFGGKQERSLDIRMYRQDLVAKTYTTGDGVPHSTNGKIAKVARGRKGALHVAGHVIMQICYTLITLFVCLKAWGGAFDAGSVTQYIGALTVLTSGVSVLISYFNDMRNNAVFLRPVFEFLDMPNDMYQGSLTTEKRSDGKYEIEFRNVSFKYPGSDEYALSNVSMKFNVGQRLAIVGENGSGKTTFIKLLCRLYDPTEGEILLNGFDIRKYDYHEYMSIFSVVFQDFQLLSFGLGQNIAASAEYDKEKAAECLRKIEFGERLSNMPKGLDTCLYKNFEDDGVEISGGEAQKIALARAIYRDAAFLVLDEPTAALDPVAEFEVYSKMDEIAKDKTAVFISHRLSSCRFCNDIAVFQSGKLVQRGGHDDLISDEDGKYHELWNAQAQYYTDNSG